MGQLTIQNLDQVHWENTVTETNSASVLIYRICLSRHTRDLEFLTTLLSPDEIDRAARYVRQKDHTRFIVSRALLRKILGMHTCRAPESLQFALSDLKKPFLKEAEQRIHFNVSHAADCILLAVAEREVGVDVEYTDPDFDFSLLLADYFSPEESAYIQEHRAGFFELWTKKEAFLKCTGQGLGEHFAVTPAMDGQHELPAVLKGNDQTGV